MGFDGLMPIEWTDIDAFCRQGFPLAPWEIEVIEKLDNFWLTKPDAPPSESGPQETMPVGKKQKLSARPITAKLFDGIFGVK